MFNAEKLLGGLLKSGMRNKGDLSRLVSGGVGMGIVGVALGAAEHFMQNSQSVPSAGGASPPPAPGTAPPPAPGNAPPPPPGGSPAPAPQADAVLLIRAMIAAANADGVIDEIERGRILERLKAVNLTEEEQRFITHELLAPGDLESIAAQVNSPETARQVYAVSLLAIDVDTPAERDYLNALAGRLGLDASAAAEIEAKLG